MNISMQEPSPIAISMADSADWRYGNMERTHACPQVSAVYCPMDSMCYGMFCFAVLYWLHYLTRLWRDIASKHVGSDGSLNCNP